MFRNEVGENEMEGRVGFFAGDGTTVMAFEVAESPDVLRQKIEQLAAMMAVASHENFSAWSAVIAIPFLQAAASLTIEIQHLVPVALWQVAALQ